MPIYTTAAQVALNLATKDNPVIGWQSFVTPGNVAATTFAAGFPASNVANPATRPPWKSSVAVGNEYLTVIPGAGQTVDYVAIAGHNLFTAGGQIGLDTCTDIGAANWVTQFVAFTPPHDGPIIFRMVPAVYQGVRLYMAAANMQRIVGTMNVGKLLVFERSVRIDVDHTPVPFAKRSKIVSGMSENGNFLGRIVQTQWSEAQVDINYIDPVWFRSTFAPFYLQSAELPFYFAWWPTKYPGDVGYVWLTEDAMAPDDTMTDRFGMTLKYAGQAT